MPRTSTTVNVPKTPAQKRGCHDAVIGQCQSFFQAAMMNSISERYTMRMRAHIILLLLLASLLASCKASVSFTEAQATAIVAGCWPGNMATPRAVTVTPYGAPTATTIGQMPNPALPTATRLPTTTPYPRCTPGPGETLIPFPTPVPPRPPYATREPDLRQGGSGDQTVFQLPGRTYRLKLAVHPTEGWPAVAIMTRNGLFREPIQSFVRVFNPQAKKWGAARQVDTGASSNGHDRFGSTVVGITGDNAIHAAWGSSDKDFEDNDPPSSYIWGSTSTDYGVSWSTPKLLAENCWIADDMATTAQGWVVVLALCYRELWGNHVAIETTMIVRQPDGTWLSPQRVELPGWYAAEGALQIVGDGDEARASVFRFGNLEAPARFYLLSKRLADTTSAWSVAERQINSPHGDVGTHHYRPTGLTFPVRRPDGTSSTGISFMWVGAYATGIYAITSLDGGQTWGPIETIAYDGRDPKDTGLYLQWVVPAYDPAANRLIAIWTCCGNGTPTAESTHFASWSIPLSGAWMPPFVPGNNANRIPLIVGSRSAWVLGSAEAANGRVVWLAWVEQENQIHVRTVNLNQIIPVGSYPTMTPGVNP